MLNIRQLGLVNYSDSWQAMRAFTTTRNADTPDELWILEHPPVYTLGQAGLPEHILNAHQIPIVKCDRGGQVTYHGPGQLVIYLLIDLTRKKTGVRVLVSGIENALVDVLQQFGLDAEAHPEAPGVYVDKERKVASLGLRIHKGCSYHGLALNNNMDLAPFLGINPCGYAGQPMTSLKQEGIDITLERLGQLLIQALQRHLELPSDATMYQQLPNNN